MHERKSKTISAASAVKCKYGGIPTCNVELPLPQNCICTLCRWVTDPLIMLLSDVPSPEKMVLSADLAFLVPIWSPVPGGRLALLCTPPVYAI